MSFKKYYHSFLTPGGEEGVWRVYYMCLFKKQFMNGALFKGQV